MSKRLVAVLVLLALLLCGCGGEKASKTAAPAEFYYADDPHLYKTEYGLGLMQGGEELLRLAVRQRQLIVGYLDLYYDAVAALKTCSFGELFAADAAVSLAWNHAMLRYTIDQRRMQPQDLSLSKWEYTARVTAVEVQSDAVTVTVREDSVQNFAAWPQVSSERYDSWHQFILREQAGEWYIYDHIDSLQEICRSHWQDAEQQTAETVEPYVQEEIDRLAAVFADRANGAPSADVTCDHPYDRAAATAYAKNHWQRRNAAWADFSDRGGNCQNYASQCLLEGGIPMDREGDARWVSKQFEDFIESMEGRSASWAAVLPFREYAERNRGFGLSAGVDQPYFSGEPGDILQMGVDTPHHTTVITDLLTDEQGNTVDYLICSNTANLKDYPAAAYPYPYRNLIKIYGWNEA